MFNVFVFEPATERVTVANILILALEKFEPKSNVKVLPVGEPPNVKIGLLAWLLPDKLKTSPEIPEPLLDISDTTKSFSAKLENTSFVPAVIVAEPEERVAVKCRLTLKLVSVIPELEVVFKVLILVFGN